MPKREGGRGEICERERGGEIEGKEKIKLGNFFLKLCPHYLRHHKYVQKREFFST